MNISNKLLINVLYFSLLSIVVGGLGILFQEYSLTYFLSIGFVAFIMTGVYLLLKNGEFIKTNAYRYTSFGVSLVIVGVMFNVMRWPYTWVILGLGFLSFPAIYLYYMIRYKRIAWLNFLKLFFISSMVLGRISQSVHSPYWEIYIAAIIALGVLLFDFIKNKKGE